MRRYQSGLPLIGLGWLATFIILLSNMNKDDLSLVVGTLVLAELFGSLLVVGWRANELPMLDAKDVLARILVRWMFLCVLVVALSTSDLLHFYMGKPLALLCALGLTLGLAVLKLGSVSLYVAQRSWLSTFTISARLLFQAGSTFLVSLFTTLNDDLVLALYLFINVLIIFCYLPSLLALWHRSPVGGASAITVGKSVNEAVPCLVKNFDLIMVSFTFSPILALPYLVARCMVHLVTVVLDLLEASAVSGLSRSFATQNKLAFSAASARINLGMLLIGGATVLLMLSLETAFDIQSTVTVGKAKDVLWLLLLGAVARMAFGAVFALMCATGMRRDAMVLGLATIGVFFLCHTISTNVPKDVALAKSHAISQLFYTGSCAALIALRLRVWPGLTALLFRQIKLF